MSKARTQPSPKTGLVFKISIALFLLLAVVLYKLNDYFKQEKWFLAQNQLRTQIVATKTAVSSQLNQLKNILSSYETELVESKINWVQLDPFFGIARFKKNGSSVKVSAYVGRSGSMGERWNAAYLETALSSKKSTGDAPIKVQLLRDKQGGKYLAIAFTNTKGQAVVVVGSSDYFQKYFDLNRGGKITALLRTTDHILAAHSEADYVATLTDEATLSDKKYLIETEEIAGTNLVAMNYVSRNGLASGFVIPWAVVGLIAGIGFIIIGLVFYSLDPMERKVEKYKKQERDQIFKETLAQNLKEAAPIIVKTLSPAAVITKKPEDNKQAELQAILSRPPHEEIDTKISASSLMAPLQQALFNLDRVFKLAGISIDKQITTNLNYDIPLAGFTKAFENIFKNSLETLREQSHKKIIVRAYDIEQNMSVIEIKDTSLVQSPHISLALTEAISFIRQAGADILVEKAQPEGVLVKLIMKKEVQAQIEDKTNPSITFDLDDEMTQKTTLDSFPDLGVTASIDLLDLEKALSLDDFEAEPAAELQAAMTSQNYKTATATAPIIKPIFLLKKKDFKVDEFQVNIRRPEKS